MDRDAFIEASETFGIEAMALILRARCCDPRYVQASYDEADRNDDNGSSCWFT